ncbi:ATP-binding cassette domain-containing protein [Citricoccus alkalitolerans]|uniref:UvrABC system protein A n=1 Tax=Citricoccus alkalitolerans TaxID=246603 RepID=A0ABV8XUZ3_9MICC
MSARREDDPPERIMSIRGAREHNLCDIDLDIPQEQVVVFVGRSGSGKSSLVMDTIAREATRQLYDRFPLHVRHRLPRSERPDVDSMAGLSPAFVVDQSRYPASSRSSVGTLLGVGPLLRLLYSREAEPSAGVATTYSFNSPKGMCPACSGLGRAVRLDLDKLLDCDRSLEDGAIRFAPWAPHTWQWRLYGHSGFYDPAKPLRDFSDREWHDLLHGSGRKVIIENDPSGVWYEGVVDRFERLYLRRDPGKVGSKTTQAVANVVSSQPCPECRGERLNEAARASTIDGLNIAEMSALELDELRMRLQSRSTRVGASLAKQITSVLDRAVQLGLGHLSLGRTAASLSGGEMQRIKLAGLLGSTLSGLMYVLDEPSAGLHPTDLRAVLSTLRALRDMGNSVLVVEHDADVIDAADYVVEIGPGAGEEGGQVIFAGSAVDFRQSGTTTSSALREPLELPDRQLDGQDWIWVRKASVNNLQGFDVAIPRARLTVVTGASGAGKSSLVFDELTAQHPAAVVFDQRPMGVNARSTVASYVGAMDEVRAIMARATGERASLFTANGAGACPDCRGRGEVEADMVFADPVVETCEACRGLRFNDEAMAATVDGLSIVDVLRLSAAQASVRFAGSRLAKRLEPLHDVDLAHLALGQMTDSLSGGERQRLRLASRLQSNGGDLMLFDEPTTGLHIVDVRRLISLFRRLAGRGHTVVVVEHDQALIAAADWVIDVGPGGGRHGGRLLFAGTPVDLVNADGSATAEALRRRMQREAGPAVGRRS